MDFIKFIGLVLLLGVVAFANVAWITLIIWAAGHFALGVW